MTQFGEQIKKYPKAEESHQAIAQRDEQLTQQIPIQQPHPRQRNGVQRSAQASHHLSPRLNCLSSQVWRKRQRTAALHDADRKSTRLNSSHSQISYAVFCLK